MIESMRSIWGPYDNVAVLDQDPNMIYNGLMDGVQPIYHIFVHNDTYYLHNYLVQ